MKLCINGSPKLSNSNSQYFLNKIQDNDNTKYLYKDKFEDILSNIEIIDTIIFSFPLYVDAPTNKVIEFMEYIENNNISIENKNVYIICNCGFWESYQNNTAEEIIKTFCFNNGAKYKGAFKIGAGEIIGKCDKVKIYKLVSIPFLFKIRKFKIAIENKEKIEMETTIRPMTKRLYILLANMNWSKKLKNNG